MYVLYDHKNAFFFKIYNYEVQLTLILWSIDTTIVTLEFDGYIFFEVEKFFLVSLDVYIYMLCCQCQHNGMIEKIMQSLLVTCIMLHRLKKWQ